MTTEPFGGYNLAIEKEFRTAISDIQVVKRWSPERVEGAGPGFSECVYGKARIVHDEVCVVGTQRRTAELSLTIRSDENAREEWESIKSLGQFLNSAEKLPDTPECRVIALMHESFEKDPPTATLLEDWSFECKVPRGVLTQLISDLSAGLVDAVNITAKWQNSVISNSPDSWGLFTVPGRRNAEPLKGHVSLIRWEPVKPTTR